MADRLYERTGHRTVLDCAGLSARLDTGQVFWRGQDMAQFDAVVVKKINAEYSPDTDDRIRLLAQLEASGTPVISPTKSLLGLVNRLSGTQALQRGQIPMPATVITEDVDAAVQAVRQWGAGVFKPMYSTKARGMERLESDDPDLANKVAAYRAANPVMYLQQALALNGQDLGMVFVGGEYLCTYARVGSSDAWNTTIHSGGKYEGYTPTSELIELGRRAQSGFDLGFTTVDLALTDQGPVVFEVSAFGGFRGALEGCQIDAAAAYADYLVDRVST